MSVQSYRNPIQPQIVQIKNWPPRKCAVTGTRSIDMYRIVQTKLYGTWRTIRKFRLKKEKHMEGSGVHRLKYPGKTFALERIVLVRADTREMYRPETLGRLGLKMGESNYFQVGKLRLC